MIILVHDLSNFIVKTREKTYTELKNKSRYPALLHVSYLHQLFLKIRLNYEYMKYHTVHSIVGSRSLEEKNNYSSIN